MITLQWFHLWPQFESGELDVETMAAGKMPRLPKTIDFTAFASSQASQKTFAKFLTRHKRGLEAPLNAGNQ